MFQHIQTSSYRPEKPTLVWDGKCGFCKYWVLHWKSITGDEVEYEPYQKVHQHFPEINESDFKAAVRLITTDGAVYSGPHAAYKTLSMSGNLGWLLLLYEQSGVFKTISDVGYQWVADHRPFMMKATKLCFGNNPLNLRPYWVFYLMIIVALLMIIFGYETISHH